MALRARYIGIIVPLIFIFLVALPYLGIADFYLSYLYTIFFWGTLAISWSILGGYAGYWSFGHASLFGAGVYTVATLSGKLQVPFILAASAGAAVAALLATTIGLVVFRINRLRGEFFALLTLSVTFVVAAIVSNTPIDGGAGIVLSGIELPKLGTSVSGVIYLSGLMLFVLALIVTRAISRSRFGMGLLAIHNDEDVAEVKGVPTFFYKLVAFAISAALAGAAGGLHSVYVGYVTVSEVFSINIPLYVVLMSILGGARHWMGPAIGATLITIALSLFVGTGHAELGSAGIALALIAVILIMPDGITPYLARLFRRFWYENVQGYEGWRNLAPLDDATQAIDTKYLAAQPEGRATRLLQCKDVRKSFGGIHALRGIFLDVHDGEILALIGPNGSGKSTLINMISGHFSMTFGEITMNEKVISGLSPHQITQQGIARTYQIPRLFDDMTTIENVAFCATFGGAAIDSGETPLSVAGQWLRFVGLSEKASWMPSALNLHDRKFVELARALAARPRLLLLDEVLSGLTPTEIDQAVNLIRRVHAGGTTIIFVEHLMRAVVALADRVAVLDQGVVVAIGSLRETMQDPRVIDLYLGTLHVA
jgi:branched-chain amino acid transport system permease protein